MRLSPIQHCTDPRVVLSVVAALTMLVCATGCGDDSVSMHSFPEPKYASHDYDIDTSLFDGRYLGGILRNLAVDTRGYIYIGTVGPAQVIAIHPGGIVLWAHYGEFMPEGKFVSTPELSVVGETLYVLDSGQETVYSCSLEGVVQTVRTIGAGPQAIWTAHDGGFLIYPSSEPNHLVDRYDASFEKVASLVPKRLKENPRLGGQCAALSLSDGRIAVLWEPDRTVNIVGSSGHVEVVLRLNDPLVRESVEEGTRELHAIMQAHPGVLASLVAFPRMTASEDSCIGVTFLYPGRDMDDESHESLEDYLDPDAQYYEFDVTGMPRQRVFGFGSTLDGIIALGSERFVALDSDKNAISYFGVSQRVQ